MILIGGSLGDIYGERRIFTLGLAGFGVFSVACAVAPTIEVLIAARACQGAAAALLTPASLAIIVAAFGPKERGAAIGSWTAWGGMAAIIGGRWPHGGRRGSPDVIEQLRRPAGTPEVALPRFDRRQDGGPGCRGCLDGVVEVRNRRPGPIYAHRRAFAVVTAYVIATWKRREEISADPAVKPDSRAWGEGRSIVVSAVPTWLFLVSKVVTVERCSVIAADNFQRGNGMKIRRPLFVGRSLLSRSR